MINGSDEMREEHTAEVQSDNRATDDQTRIGNYQAIEPLIEGTKAS